MYVNGKLSPVKKVGGKWVPVKKASKTKAKPKSQTPFQKLAARRGVEFTKAPEGKIGAVTQASRARVDADLVSRSNRAKQSISPKKSSSFTQQITQLTPADAAQARRLGRGELDVGDPELSKAGTVAAVGLLAGLSVGLIGAATAPAFAADIAIDYSGWAIGESTAKTVGKIAANTATEKVVTSLASKIFSKATLLYAGVAGWVASVGFGLWGIAESPEPIGIAKTKFLIPEAIRTGDWSAVDAANTAQDELLDLSLWEDILKWTPASAIVGSRKKLEGAIAGAKITNKIVEDMKTQQETGQSVDDYWRERRVEEAAQEKAAVDYYNSERKKMVEWEREARIQARNEDAKFWAREAEKQRKLEAADRKAIADFWFEYRKKVQEIADNNRPSNLNFGLI